MDRAEDQIEYEAVILENVPRTDLEFNIESWNKAAEAMYGVTEDEVLGERMADVTQVEYPFDDSEEVVIEFSDTGHWEGAVSRAR
jgi:PAS domain S-box-containing protein